MGTQQGFKKFFMIDIRLFFWHNKNTSKIKLNKFAFLWGKQIVGKALDIILLKLSFFEKLLGQEEIFGVFFVRHLKSCLKWDIKTLIFDKSQNRDF